MGGSEATRFSSTNQPARRGRSGPVRSGLMRSTAASTPLPRGYDDQRSRDARSFTGYVAGQVQRHGGVLPLAAMAMLREAGRASVELDRLHARREAILDQPRRKAEARRLASDIRKTRVQLILLERRIEEVAAQQPRSPHATGHNDLAAALLRAPVLNPEAPA